MTPSVHTHPKIIRPFAKAMQVAIGTEIYPVSCNTVHILKFLQSCSEMREK
jgi:hypothetical protein